MAKKVLGQGLRALIPDDSALARVTSDALLLVPLERIAPNPLQPRRRFPDESLQELAQSIRTQGVLQPIVVRKTTEGYQVVVGERRVRAARLAGLDHIPAVVKDTSTDTELLTLALVENIHRQDLNPIEEALALKELLDREHLTQQELAQRIGKSREAIANSLRLLQLPPEIQALVAEGRLTAGHARAILALPPALQKPMALRAAEGRLTVRQLERAARGRTRAPRAADPDVQALQHELEEALGARVTLACTRRGGTLTIRFHSLEELDRIVTLIRRAAR